MPVLIVLLFYIHDLVKIKRYYSQTEFVGQQMANILQNIAKKRAAEGTTLNKDDICRAASLAFLSMYPGTTQYSSTAGKWWHEFRHAPGVFCYYVKGSTGGKAKCLWGKMFRSGNTQKPLWNNIHDAANSSINSGSKVTYSASDVAPSSIYPTLKVEEGKSKIILESFLNWDSGCKDPNGNNVKTAREAFGFRFLKPNGTSSYYFNSIVIFTPNDGFPETAP